MSKGREYALERIRHILEACDAISGYVARGREVFDSDATVRDAVLYQIIVIGEAVKAAIAADATIEGEISGAGLSPWAKMRDMLTHQYWRTDREIVWLTASREVPELAAKLRPLATDG